VRNTASPAQRPLSTYTERCAWGDLLLISGIAPARPATESWSARRCRGEDPAAAADLREHEAILARRGGRAAAFDECCALPSISPDVTTARGGPHQHGPQGHISAVTGRPHAHRGREASRFPAGSRDRGGGGCQGAERAVRRVASGVMSVTAARCVMKNPTYSSIRTVNRREMVGSPHAPHRPPMPAAATSADRHQAAATDRGEAREGPPPKGCERLAIRDQRSSSPADACRDGGSTAAPGAHEAVGDLALEQRVEGDDRARV